MLAVAIPAAVIGGGAALWAALSYFTGRHFVENARYTVVRTLPSGAQLRRVPAQTVARVLVPGVDIRAAGSAGFRPLAGFIFGNNRAATGGGGDSPTSPLAASGGGGKPSSTIAMTSPVVLRPEQRDGGGAPRVEVSFVMPSAFHGEGASRLPTPNDPAVSVATVPPRTELVASFTGRYPTDAVFHARVAALRAEAAGAGIALTGRVAAYSFDPPWTMPLMARNEVAVEVAAVEGGSGVAGGGQ